ncbi:hypothetical protein GCM10009429_37370 [Dyella marensis]
MLGAAVAEAFHAGFDRAQAEAVMHVRLERVPHDMRAIELDALAVGGQAELRGIAEMLECVRDALHVGRGLCREDLDIYALSIR